MEDFPEMKDDFEPPSFDFGEEFEYKEPQFVLDFKKRNKNAFAQPKETKKSYSNPKKPEQPRINSINPNKPHIPEGAKVTEKEYFVESPSGVPVKVTTVTFHTSKSSVRNENIKNRSSHFKRDPFGDI